MSPAGKHHQSWFAKPIRAINWNMSKAKYLFESGYNKWWKRLKVVERFDKTQNELKRLVEK